MTTATGARITRDELAEIFILNTGVPAGTFDGHYDDSLESLGIDSLALLELEAIAAERYHVQVPEDALQLSLNALTETLNAARTEAA
ncbi:acyl carrier protein [Streptomyces sp. NPDC002851]